ncbi:MAG TPA: enoyl-CoA hydratase/isomerase family protein [Caulobacteraceae bacterium]|nr:enoyl-CoA hydratase/isomerase family protein [Caulobacteraceae bacterium]
MAKVRVAANGPVREVTLARADKRNALDAEMLAELKAAFTAQPPPAERVTVIRAEGPVFCAGLDLRERGGGQVGASAIEAMLHAIELYQLPVVAVVQGDAIAGGNELALHCDFVIASEAARFGMSLAKIGLAPSWFLAKKLLEVAGPVGAREMLLLGEPLPARRMAELGLIHRAVAPDQLGVAAEGVIARLAANAPLSLKAMKAVLVRAMAFRDGIGHADVDALVAAASASADAREGVAAMLERRAPRFEGR